MPHLTFPTALGPCGLAWNETGLTAFALPGSDRAQTESWLVRQAGPGDRAGDSGSPPVWVADLVARVQRHLEGQMQDFTDVPLDSGRVSPFAWRVYEATRKVPPGLTATYGDLADELGEPKGSSRAIGALLGANPWPLIVPCHRITGAGGRLTGFSAPGGVRTKARLLAIEGAQLLAE